MMKTVQRSKNLKKTKTVQLSDILIPKFQPLVNDKQHMHQILTSGRAGTKSSAMAIIANYLILSEPNTAVIIMRKHHNKLYKTVYKELLRAISRLGLNKNDKKLFKITRSPMQITYLPNGNTIYFTGSDSIDDTKGIIDEERSIKLVVLDELTEFFDRGEGEDEINNIVATFVRGNDDRFTMMYLYNPPKNPKAPINEWCKKMEQRKDCIHIHVTYKDVPVSWIGKKLVNEAETMKTADYKMYRWVWLGEAVGIDDIIYYMFDEEKNIGEPYKITDQHPNAFNMYGIGVDYGQLNATTFQCFQLNLKKMRIQGVPEYYYSGRKTGRQKSPSEYAKDFRAYVDKIYNTYGKKAVYVYIDPSAKGLAEEIKRVCPEVIIKDANNTVALGISRVQKLLMLGILKFCKEQTNLMDEIYQYQYTPESIEKGKEEPLKVNDHAMDAIRYLVMGFWQYIKHLLPFTERDD